MAILTFPEPVGLGARRVDPGVDNVQGRRLNTVIWILASLSTIFLTLRLCTKVYRNRPFWWDDWFLVGSFAALLVAIILQSVAVHFGLGLAESQIPWENSFSMSKVSLASGFCSIISLAWSKTSFSLTLMRITSGWTKWVVWFTIVTVNLVLGAMAALQWLRCWPIARAWDWSLEGSCIAEGVIEAYQTFGAIYSGTMDIFLAFLPWQILWHVQMKKKEKLGVIAAMSAGIFAGIISYVKISTLYAITTIDTATNINLFIFGTAEPSMTIVAASIPILRHLFRRDKSTGRATGDASKPSFINSQSMRLRSMSKGEQHSHYVKPADEESILGDRRSARSQE
ncbi:hypothetical protein N657DRAFT_583832 [Parathielavia appendiculata]|uniref:Rhodopsin domain-containing protein n=1 Tax=Parathielavia appendiculata TaxID=2587402 RepID=A0AAN6TQI5_9PEZI|nr:hypothetical protein N657DRAFT_583832 [Parathielavia appendiculata]